MHVIPVHIETKEVWRIITSICQLCLGFDVIRTTARRGVGGAMYLMATSLIAWCPTPWTYPRLVVLKIAYEWKREKLRKVIFEYLTE